MHGPCVRWAFVFVFGPSHAHDGRRTRRGRPIAAPTHDRSIEGVATESIASMASMSWIGGRRVHICPRIKFEGRPCIQTRTHKVAAVITHAPNHRSIKPSPNSPHDIHTTHRQARTEK